MNWLVIPLVKGLSKFISLWPRKLQLFVGKVLGLIWFYIIRVRRKLVLEHIKKAFPEKSEEEIKKIARDNFINYGQGFIELLLLPSMNNKLYKKLVLTDGFEENFQTALAERKGVYLLSLHMGSWEFMSAAGVYLGMPIHVISKKMKAKSLNEVWVNMRIGQGIKIIPEAKSTFQILKAIRNGDAIGFILDQFMGPPVGVRTKFFGHETGTMAALALFADRTRSPVVPVYNIRQSDGRLKIYFEKPIEFVEQGSTAKNISFMTQAYTSRIEEIIKQTPEQWLWLHRRWKPFRE